MTPQRLQAIKERAEKATQGPWAALSRPIQFGFLGVESVIAKNGNATVIISETEHATDGEPLSQLRADNSFIAAARQDIPDLLAYAAEMHDKIRAMIKDWRDAAEIRDRKGITPDYTRALESCARGLDPQPERSVIALLDAQEAQP